MSFNLVLNSSNVIGNNNNTYQYNFTTNSFKIEKGDEVCLSSVCIPYSWFNITTLNNNKSFTFYFPTGSSTYNTYNITLPDGFYNVNDINFYLQQICIANGLYLINSSGQNVYYLTMSYNQNYYAVQILELLVPTSLPSGFTAPSNWVGYPTVSRTPYIQILSNNTFGSIIGYTAGNYGLNATTNQSFLSNITPNATPVNSLILRCNLVNNDVTFPSDILESIPISNVSFGSNINYQPSYERWVKLKEGIYTNFTITLADQNFNPLIARDSNSLFTLMIRRSKK
jgi:hypothetical protein